MFSSEEFLTASQVARFFSRLVARKPLLSNDDLKEKLGYFPLPTEQQLSAPKNGNLSRFNLKQKRKHLLYIYIIMENLN